MNCMEPPPSELPVSSSTESDGNLSTVDACNLAYFEKYSKTYLNLAFREIMAYAKDAAAQNSSKMECILPYRLLRAMLDRPDIGTSVMGSIMLELAVCLRDQIDRLGGVTPSQSKDVSLSKSRGSLFGSKKSGKKGSLKADIIQSANLLFSSLSKDFIWEWMQTMLGKCRADVRSAAAVSCDEGTEGHAEVGGGRRGIDSTREASHTKDTDVLNSGDVSLRESPLGRAFGVEQGQTSRDDNGGKSRSLGLKALLALFMFLLQVIPKVRKRCW